MPPEGIALSTELQMHLLYNTTLFQNLQGVPANFYIFFCESPFPSPAPGHWYLGFPRLAFPYSMACSGHRQMQAIQWVQSDPHTGLPSSRRILDRGTEPYTGPAACTPFRGPEFSRMDEQLVKHRIHHSAEEPVQKRDLRLRKRIPFSDVLCDLVRLGDSLPDDPFCLRPVRHRKHGHIVFRHHYFSAAHIFHALFSHRTVFAYPPAFPIPSPQVITKYSFRLPESLVLFSQFPSTWGICQP